MRMRVSSKREVRKSMKYVIRKRCAQRITTFYRNVSKKYKHTYSLEFLFTCSLCSRNL